MNMRKKPSRPVVGVPASVTEVGDNKIVVHQTGKRYVDVVAKHAGVTPIALPSLGDDNDVEGLVHSLDGLYLTGGRANIEPHHYEGPPFPDDEIRDPHRDALVLPLIRACVEEGVPVFGSCRGIQEINVALGGSLHYRIHEVDGYNDHRMPREGTMEEKFAERHDIHLTEGGLFAKLIGKTTIRVNSLHGQGIDRLGKGLFVEAVAPDGVIEGISLPGAKALTIGAQWHVEWNTDGHLLSNALHKAFGDAARKRHAERFGEAADDSPPTVAVRAAE
jgi:putative glutamine amidotransferase